MDSRNRELEIRLCLDEDVAKDEKKKNLLRLQWKKQAVIVSFVCVVALWTLIVLRPRAIHSPDNNIPSTAKLAISADKVDLDIPDLAFAQNPSFLAQVTVWQRFWCGYIRKIVFKASLCRSI